MVRLALGALVAVLVANAAQAQESSWGSTPYLNWLERPASPPLTGDEGVTVYCDAEQGPGWNFACGDGVQRYGTIQLKRFASASDLNALREDVGRSFRYGNPTMNRGLALVGALEMQAPAYGTNNRLGMSAATYGDETAVGVNYTRRSGGFDFGVAASITQDKGMAKASAGFSW